MREPKTLVEKVWEQHVVHRAEGERAAHLRRARGSNTRSGYGAPDNEIQGPKTPSCQRSNWRKRTPGG